MTPGRPRWFAAPCQSTLLGGGCIVLAVLAAYFNSFSVPFIFDDGPSIVKNSTIRHLSQLGDVLAGPPWDSLTVNGRPLLNLTLALNYAFGGLAVGGYHGVNLAIHALAGLTLFGVVRRTLRQTRLAASFGEASLPLALCVALLWTLHPLQTEAVTYVVQRAESQVGLLYLLTLYTFIRGAASARPWRWHALSLLCCTLGMMAKEVMVSAPLMVFLYDRTFIAGSFARAWRERWRLYVGLGGTWLVLGWLMLGPGSRREAGAFDAHTVWYDYALTQFGVILHYLRLTLWPFPQIFDYGGAVVEHDLVHIVPSALVVLALVTATVIGLRFRPVLGFLGCWFFGILAPTSSFVPLMDTVFEHRMYLSLAAVIALLAAEIYRWTGKRGFWLLFALAVASGILTANRNEDYRSEMGIWTDTVKKQPGNPRAYNNLGSLWLERDNLVEAERCFRKAVELQPAHASANYNLGIVLSRTGRDAEALAHFITAIRTEDGFVDARINAGNTLLKLGRVADAVRQYEIVLRRQPQASDVHYDLGLALAQLERRDDAVREYETAIRLDPDRWQAHLSLAAARAGQGDFVSAERSYREAVRLQPGSSEAHLGLADLLIGLNRVPEAIEEYRKVLQIEPGDLHARFYLGNGLLIAGRIDEAINQYEQILRVRPDQPEVLENLKQARAMQQSSRRNP
jgi:tetratricopeptide (TPR) repeat protein